jgi:hypothetical protein
MLLYSSSPPSRCKTSLIGHVMWTPGKLVRSVLFPWQARLSGLLCCRFERSHCIMMLSQSSWPPSCRAASRARREHRPGHRPCRRVLHKKLSSPHDSRCKSEAFHRLASPRAARPGVPRLPHFRKGHDGVWRWRYYRGQKDWGTRAMT